MTLSAQVVSLCYLYSEVKQKKKRFLSWDRYTLLVEVDYYAS